MQNRQVVFVRSATVLSADLCWKATNETDISARNSRIPSVNSAQRLEDTGLGVFWA